MAEAETHTSHLPHRRVSWGAIFAGALVVVTAQLVFTLLGMAIGFGVVNPAQEQGAALSGLGTGTAWWWVITGLVSLFLGGWVAGRMSGARRGLGASLHGLVTWSLATLLTVYLVASGASAVVGGALSVVGQTAEALQRGIASMDVQPTGDVDREDVDRALDQVVQEAREVLRETEKEALQPEQVEERAEQARGTLEQRLRAAAMNPQQADEELRQAFRAVWGEAQEVATAADQEALVNALVAETDLSREEARRTVERWNQTLQDVRQQARQAGQDLVAQAEQRAGEAADALAWASFWSFLTLLFGAASGMAGGFLGAVRR